MSNASKTTKKTGTPVNKAIEVSDLNGMETKASIQTRSKGRVSEQALEVLAAAPNTRDSIETEVLYQRLGNQWYAFSAINEEVYYSAVTPTQVANARNDEVARLFIEKAEGAKQVAQNAEADIDSLFHHATTQTGRKTSNGGGNA